MQKRLYENHLYMIEDKDGRHFGRYRGIHPRLGMHCFMCEREMLYYAPEKLEGLNVRHQWEPPRKSS